MAAQAQDNVPRIPARGGSTLVRCFNGISRRTTDWDGLRRDDQLWFQRSNCYVHFHAHNTSQRGASLKVPFESIEKLNCRFLEGKCVQTWHTQEQPIYELYLPAPANLTRKDAYLYHLTSRNFFAYAIGAPLVGEKLSTALINLWDRLREWRVLAIPDFKEYLARQGYISFAQNSEHALACLKFAEDAILKDVWMDAFVHCVGMRERLDLSPEYAGISNTTQALITRAALEMDLHITRVVGAVGGFLEEELGPEHLGLSKLARDHLDLFRSFLHSYYVDKLGYFPPSSMNGPWNKRPWAGMYRDFQRLYDYLVDTESTCDWADMKGLTGGVCVIQNVQAFDERHGYSPLPNPLPLIPQPPTKQRRSISSQTRLRSLRLGKSAAVPEPKLTASQSLVIATNSANAEVTGSSLVQEYQRFERQTADGKLDMAESRKVRWLLVYSVLQMLGSIVKAPEGVKETDTPYPVCVLTSGCPSWIYEDRSEEDSEDSASYSSDQGLVPEALDVLEGRSSSRISIHPDCEADSAEDFFASNCATEPGITRRASVIGFASPPSPTRPSRTSSIRTSMHSSVTALQKSVVGSLTKRNSLRRASMPVLPQEPRKMASFCEIVVENYGNGTVFEEEDEDGRPPTAINQATPKVQPRNPLHDFDFDLAAMNSEPTLENFQLEKTPDIFDVGIDGREIEAPSPCGSYFSAKSLDQLDSNRSSYLDDEDSSPGTDLSSWDGDNYDRRSQSSLESTPTLAKKRPPLINRLTYRPSDPNMGAKQGYSSVNAGCYVPTGMIYGSNPNASKEKFLSTESFSSESSSIYTDEPQQAADIEVEDTRGRGRTRIQDRLSRIGINTQNVGRRVMVE